MSRRFSKRDFCQSSRSKVSLEITLGYRAASPYLHGNSCFATISARSSRFLQIPAIRFGLRESRSAYLGSSHFVLPRYSCHGNTRFEIQVSSREGSNLLSIAIAEHRCPRQHFSHFKFRIITNLFFSIITVCYVNTCVTYDTSQFLL